MRCGYIFNNLDSVTQVFELQNLKTNMDEF